MGDKKYFYITAVISLFIYILLILVILVYLKTNNVKKIDSFKKTTVLQLDIILDTPKKIKDKITIKHNVKNQKIAKKVVKRTTSSSMKQKTDLKSLFANVKTKATKVTKRKILNIKQSSISSRFKSKFEKEKRLKNIVLSDLLDNKKKDITIKNIVVNKSQNENDPYYSKIYQMLSNRWNPIIFANDLKAKVVVSISSNGKFSYKFIQYSSNVGFDKQLKKFLDAESLKQYPINSKRKDVDIEILFQSKG